jgi:signal transduction histidine kinase
MKFTQYLANRASEGGTLHQERRRYLISLLLGMMSLAAFLSSLYTVFMGSFPQLTIPVLLPMSLLGGVSVVLLNLGPRTGFCGEVLGGIAVLGGAMGIALLGPYPPHILAVVFPVFYVSLYLRPRLTMAVSAVAIVVALIGVNRIVENRLQEGPAVLALVITLCAMVTLVTHLLRQSQEALQAQNQRLRASEARFRAVLDAGVDALFLIDPVYDASGQQIVDARFLDVNQRAVAMLGVPREQALSKSVLTLNPQFARHMLFQQLQKIPQDAAEYSLDYTTSGGLIFAIRIRRVEQMLVVTVRDVTEARQNEVIQRELQRLTIQLDKERELNDLRATLMSTISHEFRTPLTVIMNNAEILDRYYQRLSDKQREERVLGIKEHVVQMRTMLENISFVIRGMSDRLPFKPEEADLGLYMRSLFEQVSESASETHTLVYDASGDLKHTCVDLTLLHQVVTNLLSNGIKFTPHGGQVELRVTGEEETLTITVKDSGIGIPPADLPHIFEPFHRGQNIGEVRGTGLGLSIVRECVLRHGGALEVDSKLGEGTTFTVRLPRYSQAAQPA